MTMELEPANGAILIREFDLESGVVEAIKAKGWDIWTGWEWSSSPALPSSVEVTASPGFLFVGWPDIVPDLFPILAIRYLDGTTPITVNRWEDVPLGAEVVKFEADPTNKRKYTLSVTATGIRNTPNGPQPVSASGEYEIEILQQYNANRDLLKERIDASR
ncbi:hypothetical protein CAI21_01520 [Alkalilimnicola ehrlichii]|uniref:Uncharacterized protein n=1 Tax=Alkalilimnicola ehrlichii TaxID=351052 RepID=A0A3E0X3H7_9GAMM|nr:hypothetical protein [Alkalilimnicola ehrlichii]RFA31334.1 hypothetical protein CAI21_01520 [Alkalilimnicola ehrlichii]RFA39392.1 hypothetical protein CAL65_00890 [Alkalilimnicola ehrlichii]